MVEQVPARCDHIVPDPACGRLLVPEQAATRRWSHHAAVRGHPREHFADEKTTTDGQVEVSIPIDIMHIHRVGPVERLGERSHLALGPICQRCALLVNGDGARLDRIATDRTELGDHHVEASIIVHVRDSYEGRPEGFGIDRLPHEGLRATDGASILIGTAPCHK